MLKESNSARREITKKGKEEYILNKKAVILKKFVVDNEASKKLVFDFWKSDKNDSLGKLKLTQDPTQYGGKGSYAVWEAVKGKEDLYADIKNENGIKWSFTETWLSEKGADKLRHNIMPLRSDFVEGDIASKNAYREEKRKKALKQRNEFGKENVERDARKAREYANKYEDDKVEDIERKYRNIDINRSSRQAPKGENVSWKMTRYVDQIMAPVEKFFNSYKKDAKDAAWKLSRFRFDGVQKAIEDGKDYKTIAKEIDKLKAKVKEFLDKYNTSYFNY